MALVQIFADHKTALYTRSRQTFFVCRSNYSVTSVTIRGPSISTVIKGMLPLSRWAIFLVGESIRLNREKRLVGGPSRIQGQIGALLPKNVSFFCLPARIERLLVHRSPGNHMDLILQLGATISDSFVKTCMWIRKLVVHTLFLNSAKNCSSLLQNAAHTWSGI